MGTRTLLASLCELGLTMAFGCSGRTTGGDAQGGSGSNGAPGASGKASMSAGAGDDVGGALVSGGAPSAGAPSGGAPSGGAPSGGAPSGGVDDTNAPRAGASAGGAAASAGTGGAPSLPDPTQVLKVEPSAGCSKDPIQATAAFVKYSIVTSGTKALDASDSVTGPWMYTRDYYVWLPPTYDRQKAYPLVLQGPGCGGTGSDVYSLSSTNVATGTGVNGTVIRVGLTPPPNAIGHATNPNQGCFDDREGDDSVEWPFYEALIDKLKTEVCYDQNRVFAAGNGSGGYLANELACKYAGNTKGYAIRGAASHNGSLPTEAKFAPTCSGAPMAGIWVDRVTDGDAISTYPYPIARAMKVNHCTMGTGLGDAPLVNFPIGGGKLDSTCKMILGCPAEYPLVVCLLPASGASSSDEDVVNPGFATFLQGLEAP